MKKYRIKDENDLLGVILKNCDSDREIDSRRLIKLTDLDSFEVEFLLHKLSENRFVVYTTDIVQITHLGVKNYVSPMKKALRFLAFATKEVIIYLLGIASGVAGAVILHLIGIN